MISVSNHGLDMDITKQTWIRQTNNDLKQINKTVNELTESDYEIEIERERWKRTVAGLIS